VRCAIKNFPREVAELYCQVCDTAHKIKHEIIRNLVRRARKEASLKISLLICKTHLYDCVKFCGIYGECIFLEFFEEHSDHFEKTAKGTSKHVYKF